MKQTWTLKKNYEFRRLYQRGTSAAGSCMVLYCRKNTLGHIRLGLTVSTKLGNAVKRNRARRRLRELFRLSHKQLRPGYDIILVARGKTLTASWQEMNSTFMRLCRKLNLLRESGETRRTVSGGNFSGTRPVVETPERMNPSGKHHAGEGK